MFEQIGSSGGAAAAPAGAIALGAFFDIATPLVCWLGAAPPFACGAGVGAVAAGAGGSGVPVTGGRSDDAGGVCGDVPVVPVCGRAGSGA
ncbi:hypothetical protein, partial [Stenotrophomonas maltophilia]|uniref:hypothetical protein n=1 Tax=Stenotrophomonas maltophilia TaxID=40324 RepID=UPI001954F629